MKLQTKIKKAEVIVDLLTDSVEGAEITVKLYKKALRQARTELKGLKAKLESASPRKTKNQ
jgi:hypothetical protein